MGCETWNEQLNTYFDGELTPDEARALGQHLRECSLCAADSLSRVQQKLAVRTAGKRFVPDPTFRSRVETIIKPRKAFTWSAGWIPALAAIVAGLIVSAFLFLRFQTRSQQQLLSELADLHVATLASANPVDVVSTDRHTVKPWFEGKIPFTFNLPELQGTAFTLVGGRVAYLNRTPGAELLFRIRQHQISLFIFQEQALERMPAIQQSAFSFNVVSWAQKGLRYCLVGDVDIQEMNRLSELLKAIG